MSDWINIDSDESFGHSETRLVDVDDVMVAVFNLEGKYFAIEDVCTHDGSPMLGCGLDPADLIEGDQIICPRHGARFCIRTGEALTPPAYDPVRCFPVRIHEGIVQLLDDSNDY